MPRAKTSRREREKSHVDVAMHFQAPPPPPMASTTHAIGLNRPERAHPPPSAPRRSACLNNLVRHVRGDVGRLAEELVRPRGVPLPHQLQAALQVGLPPGPALLLLPRLRRQVSAVEDEVGLDPVAQEEMHPARDGGGGGGGGVLDTRKKNGVR